jgi:L-lactate utilization protein LutC
VVSPGLFGLDEFGHLAQASTLCGACKDACPVDIDLPGMLSRVRAGMGPSVKPEGVGVPLIVKTGLRGFKFAASHPSLYGTGQRLLGWLTQPFAAFIRIPAFTGWGYSKDFPSPVKPFRARWQELEQTQLPVLEISDKTITPPAEGVSLPTTTKPLPQQFSDELELVGGQVHRLVANELSKQVIEFLTSRGIDHVQCWDRIAGLDLAKLAEAGMQIEHKADPLIKAGITSVLAVVADTGTLVIPAGSGQPLSASLLPEIHIAIVHAAQILPSLPEAFRLPEVKKSPATVLVTGPSRTADIEMTLTIGVHGPKEMHVFLVDDSPTG